MERRRRRDDGVGGLRSDPKWIRAARGVSNLGEVVAAGMCAGCGACAYAGPTGTQMVQIDTVGKRPVFPKAAESEAAFRDLSYCPGAVVDARRIEDGGPRTKAELEIGKVLEVWEGYACDEEIRLRGSSGGVLTALTLFSLERNGCRSVLHTGRDPEKPWANRTVTSRNREDLLGRTGSRYAPSSPCEALGQIEAGEGRSVFVGKPCDAAAASVLRESRDALGEKLDVILSFFCAGTPAASGAEEVIRQIGGAPERLETVDYRGQGWPGMFRAAERGGAVHELTYEESWGRLTGYRPLRCNLCPDGLGRLADITCGDAWHRYQGDGDPGRSIILVRTEKGRRLLAAAHAAGYVHLERSSAQAVLDAQPGLLQRRREIFGRMVALRMLGIPVPRFPGFRLGGTWLQQPLRVQVKTLAGTLRRALQRRWWIRNNEPSY